MNYSINNAEQCEKDKLESVLGIKLEIEITKILNKIFFK